MDKLAFQIVYLLYALPALLGSVVCHVFVRSHFRRYAAVTTVCQITGSEAAALVCAVGEARHTRVEPIRGDLRDRDHYDPRQNVIRLSEGVYGSASVAAVSLAAHEAGHAAQYAVSYLPFRIRSLLIPLTQIGANLALPLMAVGLVFAYDPLITLGLLSFCASVLLQFITLPAEFSASRIALRVLQSAGLLGLEELEGARRVLRAAALTYVAAMATALTWLPRLILISQGKRRRNI